MRKLLVALILLVGISHAQNSWDKSTALWVSDSLWNGIYVPDTVFAISGTDTLGSMIDTSVAQTSVEIPLDYQYEWLNLTCIDSGATYDDSIMVEYPIYKFAKSITNPRQPLAVTDTIWHPVHFIRDSSWTNISGALLVDDNSTKSFQIFVANYPSIRVRMLNATLVDNRIFWFMAQANRKR